MFTLIDFIVNLKTDIETVLSAKMKIEIREQGINIPGRSSYLGLVIIPIKQESGAVVNISALYEKLQSGIPYEVIVGKAILDVDQQFRRNMENYFSLFVEYEQIRNSLILQVVPTEENREKLQMIPHMEQGDKSIIYRIIIDEDESKMSSIVVTNNLLRVYGVQKEELHVDAVNSSIERNKIYSGEGTVSVINRLRANQERIQNNPSSDTKDYISRREETWKS